MVDAIPALPSTGNFKVIRIVRLVRPLAKRSPVVKNLLAAFEASFGNIGHVINLFALLILIVGLLGVQLFKARAKGLRGRGWEMGFVGSVWDKKASSGVSADVCGGDWDGGRGQEGVNTQIIDTAPCEREQI